MKGGGDPMWSDSGNCLIGGRRAKIIKISLLYLNRNCEFAAIFCGGGGLQPAGKVTC